jgi:hypothetical protein
VTPIQRSRPSWCDCSSVLLEAFAALAAQVAEGADAVPLVDGRMDQIRAILAAAFP